MQIDAHQHFWHYDAAEFPWIRPESSIGKDFLPADLQPLLRQCNVAGSVAVQARQSIVETDWLLDLSRQHAFILGVVGWVDLCSDEIEATLDRFNDQEKLVGVRHIVQDESDDNFMLQSQFQRGIAALSRYDLTYDILIFPRHLTAATQLVESFPNQPFVVDHLAKPLIARREFYPWRAHIERLAQFSNVYCKLSGFLTEADWGSWQEADFIPYFDIVLNAFGHSRLMFGSDWPVALLAGSYEQAFAAVENYITRLSPSEQSEIMGTSAARFYHLSY